MRSRRRWAATLRGHRGRGNPRRPGSHTSAPVPSPWRGALPCGNINNERGRVIADRVTDLFKSRNLAARGQPHARGPRHVVTLDAFPRAQTSVRWTGKQPGSFSTRRRLAGLVLTRPLADPLCQKRQFPKNHVADPEPEPRDEVLRWAGAAGAPPRSHRTFPRRRGEGRDRDRVRSTARAQARRACQPAEGGSHPGEASHRSALPPRHAHQSEQKCFQNQDDALDRCSSTLTKGHEEELG